jgi:dihydrolipoamide dehydrogenase
MADHRFDLVVVGSGTGLDVANWAAEAGWNVALVEKGPLGGTCLNRGCIPSKLLIHSADVMETIRRAHLFGIHVRVERVDWEAIVQRVTDSVDGDSRGIEQAFRESDNPKLFRGEARFVAPKRLRVGGDEIAAPRFLLATGARPQIPDIPGLRDVPFLTSTEALRLERQPRSMAILGGGYIAAEMAHFYGSLGTEITLIQRRDRLLPREDGEISEAFTAVYQRRFRVLLGHEAVRVRREGGEIVVEARSREGAVQEVRAEALLVATGVKPNSDTLDLAKTGVTTDEEGYIEVDANLQTRAEGIYALGDALGRYMFKHAANHEAPYAFQNLREPSKPVPIRYDSMPHAVFAGPQVAGVGATEEELRADRIPYLVGRYRYRDTAMGHALEEDDGFVKLLVHEETGKILGAHILGPEAATLIHEVIVAMVAGEGTVDNLSKAVHIHPALSEVVDRAASSLQHPAHSHAHAR